MFHTRSPYSALPSWLLLFPFSSLSLVLLLYRSSVQSRQSFIFELGFIPYSSRSYRRLTPDHCTQSLIHVSALREFLLFARIPSDVTHFTEILVDLFLIFVNFETSSSSLVILFVVAVMFLTCIFVSSPSEALILWSRESSLSSQSLLVFASLSG